VVGAHGDPVDQLVAALKSKSMLLVLDNCEHLINASARSVAALIRACPGITILGTSPQGLGIVGEARRALPGTPRRALHASASPAVRAARSV
jgi:predicted ATPase